MPIHIGLGEYECDRCPKQFGSERAAYQHQNDTGHWLVECRMSDCRDSFLEEDSSDEHEKEDHLWCYDCDRYFQNYNNLNQHMHSRIHQGTSIVCPFCQSRYATATGLSHHLETGSCQNASFLDRDKVFEIVRSKDPNGVIYKNLLGWYGSETYIANDRSWNGACYECFLCHREFNQLRSLNQHLGSPAHQQSLYHCPNSRCEKEFKTLAAICNHLESESCKFARFQQVQSSFRDLISSDRLLGF